jgi:hypothetical protein
MHLRENTAMWLVVANEVTVSLGGTACPSPMPKESSIEACLKTVSDTT